MAAVSASSSALDFMVGVRDVWGISCWASCRSKERTLAFAPLALPSSRAWRAPLLHQPTATQPAASLPRNCPHPPPPSLEIQPTTSATSPRLTHSYQQPSEQQERQQQGLTSLAMSNVMNPLQNVGRSAMRMAKN